MLPYDALQSDVTTADSIQLSVNFSYDGYPMRTSEGAAEACLEAYQALGHTSLIKSVNVILLKLLRRLFETISSNINNFYVVHRLYLMT